MQTKKVLIVARVFFPKQSPRSFRTTELAKELARQGHQVDVLLPQGLQADIEKSFVNTHGINFIYYGPLTWKPLKSSGKGFISDLPRKIGRIMFLLFEYPKIEIYFKLPKKLKSLSGYDIMISIAVPHENHWAVAKVRSKDHPIAKTWVADCGDPFVNNVLETIAPPFYFHKLENNFLAKADFVSVPTQSSIAAYNQAYHEKFRVIPQGFNFEEVKTVDVKPVFDTPTFAYAGSVSPTGIRSLHKVIAALKEIGKPFVFHVYGNNAKAVLSSIAKGFENQIVLHNGIPRSELLYKLSEMDFLVNLDNGTHLNTPSKLIDYALAKRPVLNINPLNPQRELLIKFLEGNYSESSIVTDLQSYNIANVAQQFLNLSEESK